MRSFAFTAGWPFAADVLKYARHTRVAGAPAALASAPHCASAPARPPRSAPLPGPALVMKNVIVLACASTFDDAGATSARAKPASNSFFIRLSTVTCRAAVFAEGMLPRSRAQMRGDDFFYLI